MHNRMPPRKEDGAQQVGKELKDCCVGEGGGGGGGSRRGRSTTMLEVAGGGELNRGRQLDRSKGHGMKADGFGESEGESENGDL